MFVKHKKHFDNAKHYDTVNCDDSLIVQNDYVEKIDTNLEIGKLQLL